MKTGLTGCTIAINSVRYDYPLAECIRSMLPVVDEMLVSDGGSDDGTVEMLESLAASEPKLRILHHPESLWPNSDQVGNNWVNAVRAEAQYSSFLWLDADEILDPAGFAEIRRAVDAREPRIFHYTNFWRDAQHTTLWGDGMKLHLKPTDQWMPVHGKNPDGYVDERHVAKTHPSLITYHYSALRRQEAFIAKQKRIGWRHAFGYADQPLMQSERTGESFMPLYRDRWENSKWFDGQHPEVMHGWLLAHGWKITDVRPEEPEPKVQAVIVEPPPEPPKPAERFRNDRMDSRGKWIPS